MRQHLYVVPCSQPGRLGGFSSITWHQVRQRGHNVAASSCWRRGQPGSPDDPWGPSWSGLHCHCAPQTGHIMVEKVRGRSLLTPCPARAVAASDLQGLQALERRGWTRVRGFNHIMAIAVVTLPIGLQDWNHRFAVNLSHKVQNMLYVTELTFFAWISVL